MASAVNFPSVQSTQPKPKVAEYTRRRIHGEGGPLEFFAAIELTDRQAIALLIEHYGPR